MTTYSTSTRIRHDSDANFREWINEYDTGLTTAGLVRTADTGQVNFATVTRAGINADAGYSLYYMNDSLHGTYPVYIKIYWGTGAATDRARLRMEVGTGSSGTGTLTGGDGTIRTISTNSTSSLNTDTTYPSYWCMARGAVWAAHKVGRPTAGLAHNGFLVARNCDANGDFTNTGIVYLMHNGAAAGSTTANHQRLYFATSSWTTLSSNVMNVWPCPDTASVSDEDGYNQFMIPFYGMLRPRPFNNFLWAWSADMTQGTTYSLTGVGSTAYTYICLDRALGAVCAHSGAGTTSLGMLAVYE